MRPLAFLSVAALFAAAGLVTRLPAQDAIDFMREEWQRQHRSLTPSPEPYQPPQPAQPQPLRPPEVNSASHAHLTVRPRSRRPGPDQDAHMSGNALCVRTCDGYYFPAPTSEHSVEACSSLCPGAHMEVYRTSGDAPEQAVSRRGRRYTSLSEAFSYRKGLKDDCTCRQQSATALERLRQDATLVPGDIVVTENGVHVFTGGAKPPYPDESFVPLRKAHGLSRQTVSYLSQIDQHYRTVEDHAALANEAASARAQADSAREDSGSRRRHARRGR